MFRKLFSPDSDLMVVMSWITDCIFLSLFWIMACVPVVTVGAATAALYDASYRGFRRKDRHSWQRFFGTFKNSFKGGILPGVFVLAVLLGGGWLLIRLWNDAVLQGAWLGFAAGALVAVIVLGAVSVVLPMVSRFENKPLVLIGNALRLALANLPRTFLLGMLQAAAILACARLVLPVLILPCLTALLSSLLVEPMFSPFLPEDFYEDDLGT